MPEFLTLLVAEPVVTFSYLVFGMVGFGSIQLGCVSPSKASLSCQSAGLGPSQMRSMAA